MSRRIVSVVAMLICIYLDSIFFPQVNLYDIRPDAMLAVTVSLGILAGSAYAATYGAIGGLLMDIVFGRFVGLSALLYLIIGLAAGFFYKKFYADNSVVPAATAAAAGFFKDFVFLLVLTFGGAKLGFGALLIRYVLPSALMSSLLCIIVHWPLKPLMERQVKRSQ